MAAGRIVVAAADAAMRQALRDALAATGATVDERAHTVLDDDALTVVHLVEQAAIPERGGPLVAVLPRTGLERVVDVLQASARVVGVIVADAPDDLDGRELASLARGILADDLFGLDKLVAPGTPIHTVAVRHYEDRRRCIAEVAGAVLAHPHASKHRDAIEQSVDEMLMNALFNAPVDAAGKPVFAGVPVRTRVMQRTQQTVLAQYACDGKQLAVAVRDAYGSLAREVVLRYLYKSLHSSEKVDRKAGGAGLGLYLMLSGSSAVYFHLLPGVATEVICVFDLESSRLALGRFGCAVQREPRGLVGVGPARPRAASPKRKILATTAVVAAVGLGIGGVLAWPVLFPPPVPTHAAVTFVTDPPGATIELEGRTVGFAAGGKLVVDQLEIGKTFPVVARLPGHAPQHGSVTVRAAGSELALRLTPIATLELDSDPTGATVTLDGKALGTTPLEVTTLPPKSTATLAFARLGYRTAIASVAVPAAGSATKHVQPLEVSDDYVRVRFTSDPPGAEVVTPGAPPSIDRTYTPAEIMVEVGKPARFLLTMPRRVPALVELTPARGKPVERAVTLAPGATLRIEAARGGTGRVVGAPHCQALAVPFECTLAPGAYSVEVGDARREVTVGTDDATVRVD